jgi:hypothetical protein
VLKQTGTAAGRSHYGPELQQSAEEKAERLVQEELARIHWNQETLRTRRKGDPAKVEIALRLREKTTMTVAWIASRLQMGARTYLSHLLYIHRNGKPTPASTRAKPVPPRFGRERIQRPAGSQPATPGPDSTKLLTDPVPLSMARRLAIPAARTATKPPADPPLFDTAFD